VQAEAEKLSCCTDVAPCRPLSDARHDEIKPGQTLDQGLDVPRKPAVVVAETTRNTMSKNESRQARLLPLPLLVCLQRCLQLRCSAVLDMGVSHFL
jgi:hypothetical protein